MDYFLERVDEQYIKQNKDTKLSIVDGVTQLIISQNNFLRIISG